VTGIGLLPVGEPTSAAKAAASAAGVEVRELAGMRELGAAVDLLSTIWGRTGNPPLAPELLRAFSKAGNYVSGAFEGGRMVGATVGFHASPEHHALHSHISGVLPECTGRAVGFAMKLHQRAWALGRGIPIIEWTFDPLVSRNAHFNIAKLGARPIEYLDDFYGSMDDAINAGDQTDRLLVRWDLGSAAVVEGAATGRAPAPHGDDFVFVAVPADIERLRRDDPALAREWRVAVRVGLADRLRLGHRVVGFDRERGYVLSPRPEESSR
jgi:predicted GNAT superfamily acetyltransferase